MKTTTVRISDDLGGAGEAETVTFSFGGTDYEIDLNKRNRKTFERHMQRWITGSRVTDRVAGSATKSVVTKPVVDAGTTVLNARIRVWASMRGLLEGASDTISEKTVLAFYEAHPHLTRD